jgi:hypothetical protein
VRRLTPLRLALAGGVLLLAAFVVLAIGASVNGGMGSSARHCVLGDEACTTFAEHVHDLDPWSRASDLTSLVALVALAAAAVRWPRRPKLVTLGALLVGCVLLLQLQGLLDYATCDEPGYNDATLLRIALDDWVVGLSIAWAPIVALVVIVRYAFVRREFVPWAGVAIVAMVASLPMVLLTAAADLC